MQDLLIYTDPLLGNFYLKDLIIYLDLLIEKHKKFEDTLIYLLNNLNLDKETISSLFNISNIIYDLNFIKDILQEL